MKLIFLKAQDMNQEDGSQTKDLMKNQIKEDSLVVWQTNNFTICFIWKFAAIFWYLHEQAFHCVLNMTSLSFSSNWTCVFIHFHISWSSSVFDSCSRVSSSHHHSSRHPWESRGRECRQQWCRQRSMCWQCGKNQREHRGWGPGCSEDQCCDHWEWWRSKRWWCQWQRSCQESWQSQWLDSQRILGQCWQLSS